MSKSRKKKNPFIPFLYLAGFLLCLLSLPRTTGEKIRGLAARTMAPLWDQSGALTESIAESQSLQHIADILPSHKKSKTHLKHQIQNLELENLQLRSELVRLLELFEDEIQLSSLLQEREELLNPELIPLLIQSFPARVIYRANSSWNSSLWLDVGEEANRELGKIFIEKNCPVVIGHALIGVIDEVQEKQSHVRLITDPGLKAAVCSIRGHPRSYWLAKPLDDLLNALNLENSETCSEDIQELLRLKHKLIPSNEKTYYLAKGELGGTKHHSWMRRTPVLEGIGFNCDFQDDRSPSRDLDSGKVLDLNHTDQTAMPIIKINDLLITTGMDGIFPSGLHVATVTKVHPLQEGAYFYKVEAIPVARKLNEVKRVSILAAQKKS